MTPRMIRLSPRYQRTLVRPVWVSGPGMITGQLVRLCFRPAPVDTGIIFVRTDLPGSPRIPAHADRVTDTRRRTTLGNAPATVTLVEHTLAALSGLRIDNCLVEINGVEPPGLDGSSLGFVQALQQTSIELQHQFRPRWTVTAPITVAHGPAMIRFHPADDQQTGLGLHYLLDYGADSPIPRQIASCHVTPASFVQELAACRTFVLEQEAEMFRQQGIGQHLGPRDLLVFGPRGLVENSLRFADEPSRHKMLDLLGDLALCGVDLVGDVVAYRSGHPLNVELAKTLAGLIRQTPFTTTRRVA
ncbi:UDP-3-O-acyl-N-acetylglucosamine deacetylase [Tuwongella immobilis]|nr:UDP-3-O-acyl-N-acetylglucosamine deacetylase [Tuwongella immobilis]